MAKCNVKLASILKCHITVTSDQVSYIIGVQTCKTYRSVVHCFASNCTNTTVAFNSGERFYIFAKIKIVTASVVDKVMCISLYRLFTDSAINVANYHLELYDCYSLHMAVDLIANTF